MEQRIRDWVSRDSAGYGYLLDFYRRGARVCYIGDDALILKHDTLNICYAGGDFVDVPELHNTALTLTESKEMADTLMAEGCYQMLMVCRQTYYLGKEAPRMERPGVTVRPLTMDDLDFVLENYHHPGAFESHIRGRIAEGMLGAEVDGELAGFIGVHQEGCMGLLEILPQFRRRGIAEVLEAALIRRQLERGSWPYGHVIVGNHASDALQKKMGMTFDNRRLMYWLCPE